MSMHSRYSNKKCPKVLIRAEIKFQGDLQTSKSACYGRYPSAIMVTEKIVETFDWFVRQLESYRFQDFEYSSRY